MSRNRALCLAAACLLAIPTSSRAQNPITGNATMMYSMLKVWVMGAAEKMPEINYRFRPTPEVRAFGEIIGHLADVQYRFCSVLHGEADPKPAVEKSLHTKAELMAALEAAYAYCDRAYRAVNDSSAATIIKLDGRDFPRVGVLNVNNLHITLHYGNLITYLRLKNVVPPSSDPAYLPAAPKK